MTDLFRDDPMDGRWTCYLRPGTSLALLQMSVRLHGTAPDHVPSPYGVSVNDPFEPWW